MKSLKRTLSLVLALVMVLGLFGGISMTAAASDYTDDKDIQYKEAVDVMTAIGAINGRLDGTFDPKNTISRAEAAKLVAYTILGKDAATDLSGVTSRYSDVPASQYDWAIPSIEYLSNMGVINGVGGNNFAPEENIDGYAILKMLLCAIGYGAKGEYVGDKWALNVAIDASKANVRLTEGLAKGVTQSSDATREEVALYCLNAIQADKVKYVSTLDVYVDDNGGLVGGGTTHIMDDVYPTLRPSYAYDQDGKGFKFDAGRTLTDDPANVWRLSGKVIGRYAIEPAYTYTTNQTAAALASDLTGLKVINSGVTIAVNGSNGAVCADATDIINALASDKNNQKYCGNSTLVRVYIDKNSEIGAVTVVKQELAVVSVNPANGAVTLTVMTPNPLKTAPSKNYVIAKTDDLYAAVSGYKDGDRVVITPVDVDPTAGTNWIVGEVATPTTVSGKVTTHTTPGVITIDGKDYPVAAGATETAQKLSVDPNTDIKVWLDSKGFVVDAEVPDAPFVSDLVYVLRTVDLLTDNQVVVPGAVVVYTNGTTATLKMTNTKASVHAGDFYNTGKASDGVYTLVQNTAINAGSLSTGTPAAPNKVVQLTNHADAVTATKPTLGYIKAGDKALNDISAVDITTTTKYYNNKFSSDIKFIYISSDYKTVTVEEGVQNVTLNGTSYAAVEARAAGINEGVVTAIFLYDVTPSGDSKGIAFFPQNADGTSADMLKTTTLYDKDKKPVVVDVYRAWIDGEEKEISVKTGTTVNKNTFYTVTDVSGTEGLSAIKAYTSPADADIKTAQGTIASNADGNITVGGTTTVGIKNAAVIDVRTSTQKEQSGITSGVDGLLDAIKNYKSVSVSVIYDVKTGEASAVYILSNGAQKYAVKLEKTSLAVTNGGSYTFAINDATVAENDDVTLTIIAKAKPAPSSDTLTIKVTDSEKNDITSTKYKSAATANGNWTYDSSTGVLTITSSAADGDSSSITFTMPDGPITISITGSHT